MIAYEVHFKNEPLEMYVSLMSRAKCMCLSVLYKIHVFVPLSMQEPRRVGPVPSRVGVNNCREVIPPRGLHFDNY